MCVQTHITEVLKVDSEQKLLPNMLYHTHYKLTFEAMEETTQQNPEAGLYETTSL